MKPLKMKMSQKIQQKGSHDIFNVNLFWILCHTSIKLKDSRSAGCAASLMGSKLITMSKFGAVPL